MAKYQLLRDRLVQELPGIVLAQAPAASDGELALAHTPAYIEAISHGTLSAAAQREIGFPWSPGMAERARRSAGATLSAARVALGIHSKPNGVAANIAGGTQNSFGWFYFEIHTANCS